MKKTSWINRLEKTAPELPYQPPIWLGDHSNGEHYHQITPEERSMRELILREGAERARYYGMERREFMASGLGVARSMSVINLVNGCSEGAAGGGGFDPKARDAGNDAGSSTSKKDAIVGMNARPDPEECAAALQFMMSLPQGRCGKDLLDCYSKPKLPRTCSAKCSSTWVKTTWCGAPTACGTARRNRRSRCS